TLDQFVPGLEAGKKIIVSGKRIRVVLVNADAATITATDDSTVTMKKDESALLLEPYVDAANEDRTWHVLTKDGFDGSFTGSPSTFKLASAEEDDDSVAEVATIKFVDADGESPTKLTLEEGLKGIYDRA